MHINHLIWDRIFEDPEYGGISYKEMLYPKVETSFDVICEETNYLQRLIYRYSKYTDDGECRGIYIIIPNKKIVTRQPPNLIPSLQISCAVFLVESWAKEFREIAEEMYDELEKLPRGPRQPDYKIKDYASEQYLRHLFKDVFDAIHQYKIDLYSRDITLLRGYNNNSHTSGPRFYSEDFMEIDVNVDTIA